MNATRAMVLKEKDPVTYTGARPELKGKHGIVYKTDSSGRIAVRFEGLRNLSFVHFSSLAHRAPKVSLWQRFRNWLRD